MTWEAIGVIVGIVVVFSGLITFVFQPRSNCAQCQKNCRSEIYGALNTLTIKVNDKSEILTAVNAKLDVLLLGLNIKVETRKHD
jgi:hypothetical protein